jgi:hypothetical protein
MASMFKPPRASPKCEERVSAVSESLTPATHTKAAAEDQQQKRQ